MIAVKKDVVDGVAIAAVRACGVVASIGPEVGGIASVECVAGNELEGSRLVSAGLGGENPFDEGVKG